MIHSASPQFDFEVLGRTDGQCDYVKIVITTGWPRGSIVKCFFKENIGLAYFRKIILQTKQVTSKFFPIRKRRNSQMRLS